MTGAVLAVDQGTSGTKALVICPERGVVGTGFAEVHPRHLPGGLVEVDPEELYGSVVDAGHQALAEAGRPVTALGLANQGETVLAWDPDTGRPLTRALVWQDRRAEPICTELSPRADELRHLSGLPLDPYFAAPKMAWIRRHLTRDGRISTSDSWLIHRLTGAHVTDAATASRTQLLDLDRADWSPRALELYGLSDEPFPDVVDNAAPVGTTSVFGPEIPLTGLAVDQQAALLAQRVTEPSTAKCTYGTGAFLLAHTGDTPRRGASGLAGCVAWRLGGRTEYCLDGQVYTAASAVRWLTGLGVISGAADLDPVGATVPDSGGVTFVPALAGLAAPGGAATCAARSPVSAWTPPPATWCAPCARASPRRSPNSPTRRPATSAPPEGAPRRRRTHPLGAPHADPGRPPATPRGGVRPAGRHRARRGSAGPPRRGPGPDARLRTARHRPDHRLRAPRHLRRGRLSPRSFPRGGRRAAGPGAGMRGIGWVPGPRCAGEGPAGSSASPPTGPAFRRTRFRRAVHALLAGGPGMTRAVAVGVTFAGNPS